MDRCLALPLTLLSSLMLWLAFYPVNWGWLGWIALIPLLATLQQYLNQPSSKSFKRTMSADVEGSGDCTAWHRRPLFAAWLGGLFFCLVAFQWIRVASTPMYATWIVLAVVVSLHWVFFFLFTRLIVRVWNVPLILAAPVTWTGLEYLRSQIWIGFAWYYLGHTQHEELHFVQAADVAGVYGLSFMMMMVNVGLWRVLSTRSLGVVARELVPAVVAVGLACWYGSAVLGKDAEHLVQPQTDRIAVLQGNQPQDLRNDPEKWRDIDPVYGRLGDRVARHQPKLMIAPETCLSFPWVRLTDDALPQGAPPALVNRANECRQWAREHARRWRADLLFGFVTYRSTDEARKLANSAVLIDQEGRERGCYDKIYCLPFGEYIPWAETLPFMKWFSPYNYEYTVRPGTDLTVLQWDRYRIASLICYEDTVPDLTRAFMTHVNPDFFVNLSNDGWFKGWEEHEQHLVCARFRCIETRRSMVRAVNMGISAIIDSLGRIVALPEGCNTWRQAKDHAGILIGSVPLSDEMSLYMRWGDVLPWTCWAVVFLALVHDLFRRSFGKKPSTT